MISVVVYGRNDDYGYNLHKRAALSLNCIAEVLSEDDEILFVDYNTPDEFPTFPEAIRDTLTQGAQRLIRVLRVREAAHRERFAGRTHLAAVEPVARNVGVRRSNPRNRWILSTNTDMIFLTHSGRGLAEEVAELADGFYCAPRVELPEAVWETFERTDPSGTMRGLRELRRTLHLDEIVHGTPTARYDAPGDFQLALREDLLAIGGFHEGMLKGWHVDSNLSARMLLRRGAVEDAGRFVLGYHCDHLRKITPMHRPGAVENSLAEFVDEAATPELLDQMSDWGLADLEVEEIHLNGRADRPSLVARLARQLHPPLGTPYVGSISPEVPDSVPAPAQHILPFLASVIEPYPRGTSALWLGPKDEMWHLFEHHWRESGFVRPILDFGDRGQDGRAERVVLVNFGTPALAQGAEMDALLEGLAALVLEELDRLARGDRPSRVLLVNGIYNRNESMVRAAFDIGRSPFSTRLSIGVIRPDAVPPIIVAASPYEHFGIADWTTLMVPGSAGRLQNPRAPGRGPQIVSSPGTSGHVAVGPRATLPSGEYVAEVHLSLAPSLTFKVPRAYVDVAIAERAVAARRIAALLRAGSRRCRVPFRVTPDDVGAAIEVRLHTNGRARLRLRSVRIQRTA